MKTYSIHKNDKNWALLFLVPALIFVLVFMVYPIARNVQISVSEYTIKNNATEYIGLENYKELFTERNGRFFKAYRNNILYAVVTTPIILFFGIVIAYMINKARKGGVFFRTLYYIPVITSWVIVGLVFRYIFYSNDKGFLNYLLVNVLHVIDKPISWLTKEWPGNIAIWTMGIWKNIGYAMIIYLAALQGVPKNLYESAEIEGASEAKKLIHITMPLVRPTTFFLLVQFLIGSFNVFLQVLMLTGGDPRGATSTLQYLLYERTFNLFEFGQGAAIGVITAISVFVISIVLNKSLKRERYIY